MTIFDYSDEDALGKVASVDTAKVVITVEDTEKLKRLQVNRLAVLQSSKPGQHFIGLISQVTRKKLAVIQVEGEDSLPDEQNLCKVS